MSTFKYVLLAVAIALLLWWKPKTDTSRDLLAKDNEEMRNKLALIASLLNENAAGGKVYIDSDWKISEMPKHLNLSRTDREWLSKYVK